MVGFLRLFAPQPTDSVRGRVSLIEEEPANLGNFGILQTIER